MLRGLIKGHKVFFNRIVGKESLLVRREEQSREKGQSNKGK